jgi:endonuclease/exonuclease/phosphatase family metal-dependent hydrolase
VAATRRRVVSWNIRAAIGPGPFPDRWWRHIDADRLRAIGAFLSGLDAEVIALQEVALVSCDGNLVDNPGDLGRLLGMEVRYAATRSFEVREDGALLGVGLYGNALLARLRMSVTRCVSLPAAPRDAFVEPPGADHPTAGLRYADAPGHIREPRCLLLTDVEGLGRVGTAHFSHIGSGERRLQAEAVVAAFGAAVPALLVGDLNAAIEAPELGAFADWTDGFTEPPGDPARVSTDDGYRIDHVLGRGVAIEACRVDRSSGELSDHFPVVAEVRVDDAVPLGAAVLDGPYVIRRRRDRRPSR